MSRNFKDTYSVPNLEFDDLIIDFEAEATELHTDGDLMLGLEFVVHDSLHEGWLSNASVSDYYKLEQVILGGKSLVADDFERHLHQLIDLVLLHYLKQL